MHLFLKYICYIVKSNCLINQKAIMDTTYGIIITSVLLISIFLYIAITKAYKAHKRKIFGGNQILAEEIGVAVTDIIPGETGKVKIRGEIWKAESEIPVHAGKKVVIVEIKLLTLIVKPK